MAGEHKEARSAVSPNPHSATKNPCQVCIYVSHVYMTRELLVSDLQGMPVVLYPILARVRRDARDFKKQGPVLYTA